MKNIVSFHYWSLTALNTATFFYSFLYKVKIFPHLYHPYWVPYFLLASAVLLFSWLVPLPLYNILTTFWNHESDYITQDFTKNIHCFFAASRKNSVTFQIIPGCKHFFPIYLTLFIFTKHILLVSFLPHFFMFLPLITLFPLFGKLFFHF